VIPYALREALAAFRRTPLLTGISAGMIALSLFLLGLFGLVAHNIREVLRRVESRVEIVAYLRDTAPPPEVEAAQQQIRTYREVRDVRYVSREQALQKAREELPEFRDVFGGISANPLPASLEIAMQPNQRGPEAVESLAARVAAYPFVEDVRYGSDWLDKVYLLRRVAGVTTLLLGASFAMVAALIIAAAVRMAIYARRDEISIMRLVGATAGFVRRPFLIEGLITGVLGGMVALGLTYAAFRVLNDTLFEIQWLPETWIASGLIGGAALGVIASGVAVRRYLREV
jgi:cell division transport system permease protein